MLQSIYSLFYTVIKVARDKTYYLIHRDSDNKNDIVYDVENKSDDSITSDYLSLIHI